MYAFCRIFRVMGGKVMVRVAAKKAAATASRGKPITVQGMPRMVVIF